MSLYFKELNKYSFKNNDYPDIITKEIIYENQKSYTLSNKEDLRNKTENFIEGLWVKTRNKYIRCLKSNIITIFTKKPGNKKIIFYTIDCTPRRYWFKENDIEDEFKTSKYRIFIKQSTTLDLISYNYKNHKFEVTKKLLEQILEDKILFLKFISDKFNYTFKSSRKLFYGRILSETLPITTGNVLPIMRYAQV